jgi:hypothetical protein
MIIVQPSSFLPDVAPRVDYICLCSSASCARIKANAALDLDKHRQERAKSWQVWTAQNSKMVEEMVGSEVVCPLNYIRPSCDFDILGRHLC